MKTKIQAYAAAHQSEKINVITVAKGVLKEEGIPSLYEGVLGVMLGSAAVKATAFTTNSMALSRLGESDSHVAYTGMPTIEHLTMAAAIAGMPSALFSKLFTKSNREFTCVRYIFLFYLFPSVVLSVVYFSYPRLLSARSCYCVRIESY
jgi:hypothetical protein